MPICARPLLFLLLLVTAALGRSDEPVNRLAGHPSPYLASHAEDPVAWQPWGPDVLAQARASNRPILISSGYFACHWCHVMQRDSFRDPEVAARINAAFIPVKIDRELEPALDDYLIEFVRRTRGVAGWPLNVFLTPDGYPFFGLVYAPRDGFLTLIDRIAATWASRGTELALDAQLASLALPAVRPTARVDPQGIPALLRADLLAQGDRLQGGLGGGNRFPMAPVWEAALDLLEVGQDPELAGLVTLTLDRMAEGGMRDPIGGGFFRYTTDPDWETPHYEKMLYDQALLVRLYLRAARVLGRPAYREVARDTLRFTLEEMLSPGGGFVASLSAVDRAGEEGGGYRWSRERLAEVLDATGLELAALRWNLGQGGLPRPGRSLEQIAATTGRSLDDTRALESEVRTRLRAARGERPPVDGKRLAAWNGLMLAALADAVADGRDPAHEAAARALRGFLTTELMPDGHLVRAREGAQVVAEATVEDYAGVAQGLWRWHEVHGDPQDRDLALGLVRQAWARFHDGRGWRRSEGRELPGMGAEPALADNPLPSPSAILIELARRSGDPELEGRAAQAMAAGLGAVAGQPVGFAGHARLFW